MIRTFIAVELGEALRRALAQAQTALRGRLEHDAGPGVRIQWVRPDSIHLTLKFLGNIPEERVSEIHAALARVLAMRARFTVAVEGLGVFPDVRAPRVLWVGLADQGEALRRLAADVETALEAIGFAAETKPFHPHLTLARIKERSREAGRALAAGGMLEQAAPVGSVDVGAVAVMRSELRPSGAVYTKLCEVPLTGA